MQDVGHSILESYSRVMESLAFNIMARIDDVLYVDDTAKRCSTAELVQIPIHGNGLKHVPNHKVKISMPDLEKLLSYVENLSGRSKIGRAHV